jgi:two-component system LytT family response regulator
MIIDDEKDAQELIKEYLGCYTNFQILGICENGRDAVLQINACKPDIIFLDVNLPCFDGFQVITQLTHEPQVIMTTAHDYYAVKAFDHDAIDYLLKPFSLERFEMALKKILY